MMYDVPERFCGGPGCPNVLVLRPHEGHKAFLIRKCCSAGCSNRRRAEKGRAWHEAARQVRLAARDLDPGGWPRVTGPIKTDFRAHNNDPGDLLGHLPLRPATLVKTGTTLA